LRKKHGGPDLKQQAQSLCLKLVYGFGNLDFGDLNLFFIYYFEFLISGFYDSLHYQRRGAVSFRKGVFCCYEKVL
jgi:hypothetical protein